VKRGLVVVLFLSLAFTAGIAQEWSKADSLRKRYFNEGRYDSSLFYADEAAAIMRGTIGENNLRYGFMLRNLAVNHYYLGNFRKAKYYILKETLLWEAQKKKNDPEYINSLMIASLFCRISGDYEEALTQIKKAEQKAYEIYKPDSEELADVLLSFAGVYHDMGCSVNDMINMKMEDRYLKRAEGIYLKYAGQSKEKFIIVKSDEGAWNNNLGNSPQAEFLLKLVVDECLKKYGPGSQAYASALNNLGVLYYNTGNYKLSEKYLVDAAAIFKKSNDPDCIQTGICLNNIGALYLEMGNHQVAASQITEAKRIFQKNSRQESPEYAVIMNNLGSVLLSEEYYAAPEDNDKKRLSDAGKSLLAADSVFSLNCQKPHPFYFSIISNLAIWYNLTGDTKKSSKIINDLAYEGGLSLRVVAMMNKMSISSFLPSDLDRTTGPDPVLIPVTVKLIDQVMASNSEINSSGESDAITTALLRMFIGKATNIRKAVGPYHPAYGSMLKSLITVYASIDDVKTEEELTLQYLDVTNHRTLQDFSFLSESEKEMYYQTRLPDMYSFTSYSLARKRTNPSITRYTYNNILLNKGLMLKSSTAMRLAILNSNNPELLKQYDDWIALKKEISVLYGTPVEMRTKDVTELEKEANTLERSLVASSQDFNDYRRGMQITWEDVKKNLKPDEAAIEFTDFKRMERSGGNEVIYCALILRSDSEYPEMVKLFNEEQLRYIIDRNDVNDFTDINEIYGTVTNQSDKLYNLIWKPLEGYLSGVKNVYISPSGLLNKISFPALSNGKDMYLCDNYRIQVKGSTGNIVTQNLFSQGSKPAALVFGGIQYSLKGDDQGVWNYLKGTKDEGDAVITILEEGEITVRYLTGNEATETYFKKNAAGYNILHLATHGFFFGDPNVVRFKENNQEVEYGELTFRGTTMAYGVNSFVNNENPLMRSGLVLAGANEVWVKTDKGDSDDGVLTAQEVTQIDLRKNDLVVLSACETGLGDIKGGEGVYGLQRALKMAGVKYIIMSLWQIPDRETVEFMGTFYNYLLKDKDIKTAFYKTQKEMRAKYDPYYWGAFVLME
jgi:CHAT domain-containing protein